MAITPINPVSAPRQQAPVQGESWHDKILRNLQIAGSAFGIATDFKTIQKNQAQIEQAEANTKLTQQRTLDAPAQAAAELQSTEAKTEQSRAATEKLKTETGEIKPRAERERLQAEASEIEKIDKRVDAFIQRPDVKESIKLINGINTIESLLELETPTADMQAATQASRALAGESGVLTDRDVERITGTLGLDTKLQSAVKKWITGDGSLTKLQRDNIKETVAIARARELRKAKGLTEAAQKNFNSFKKTLPGFNQEEINRRISIESQIVPVEELLQEARNIISQRDPTIQPVGPKESFDRGVATGGEALSGFSGSLTSGIKEAAQGAAISQRETFDEVITGIKERLKSVFGDDKNIDSVIDESLRKIDRQQQIKNRGLGSTIRSNQREKDSKKIIRKRGIRGAQ